MSERTPTLQQLLKALKKLENWFLFGAMLGVPVPQLKKIESSYSQREPERYKIDMLQYWLDNKLVPTWNEVVLALEETDQLGLAAQIKSTYLWSTNVAGSEEEGATRLTPELNTTLAANFPSALPPNVYNSSALMNIIPSLPTSNPPLTSADINIIPPHTTSTLPLTSATTTKLSADEEIKAEIKADMTVVSNLKELEKSFGHMLVQVKRHLSRCDLSDALIYLSSVIGSEEFIGCDNFGKIIRQLQQHHIDVFNISNLQDLVANFERDESGALLDELSEVIEAYNEKKESFLKQTTVLEFQRAVVSRVKPFPTSGQASVTIKIPEGLASRQTLKDIEKLAMEGFEECHKKFIRLHAEPGSVIISWVFPKKLSSRLEQLARDNAAVFEDNGVVEVTVGGRRVFPCTQQEDIHMASQVISEEEKSKLKQLYTDFYHQLVEAVSDPDSFTTQFHSASVLSQKEQAVSSSSLARVLGVEEPHLLTVLMEKMSTVKQLQILLEDMIGWLSGTRPDRQQLIADIERLTSGKTNLLTRLQWYEEDFKTSCTERQQLIADIERLTSGKTNLLTSLQWYEEDFKTSCTERQQLVADIEKLTSEKTNLLTSLQCYEEDFKTSCTERQQLVADMERLTSDKADLLTRLQLYEEDFKTANECIMAAVHGVEEREERISHLKKELEELRAKLQSRGRESLLTRENEDLKSELVAKTDEIDEVIKSSSELIVDSTHLLEEKDDMICSQKAKLLHLKHVISHLHKKNSQTEKTGSGSEQGRGNTSRLLQATPAVYSSQAHAGFSMSSDHSTNSGSGASSEGYHSLGSLPKHYTPSPSGPLMHHQQQHVEFGTPWGLVQDFSQVSLYPRYKMGVHTQLQGDSASKEQSPPLAHKVSGPNEYSSMEFWCMAKDEFTKFNYKLLESASKMNLPFKYENPISKQFGMNAREALRGPALDFRWQLKHLEYNRSLFCREMFKQKIGEPEFRKWTRNLREKADKLAYNQHLQDDLRMVDERVQAEEEKSETKAGTSDAISHLLDEMIQFTEKICDCQMDIPGLDIHVKNLRDIRDTVLENTGFNEAES